MKRDIIPQQNFSDVMWLEICESIDVVKNKINFISHA